MLKAEHATTIGHCAINLVDGGATSPPAVPWKSAGGGPAGSPSGSSKESAYST